MKRTLRKVVILTILGSLITFLFQNSTYALNPNITHVTSDDDIEELLGTTSSKARQENLLGLASKYSVFVEEDFTIHDAETGGKLAAGGKVEATTDYKYQVGSGLYNYSASEHNGEAEIVVGNGPIKNVETLYGATIEGENYNMKKKVVVSEDATSMNWEDFSEEEQETFVQANAISFSDEFQYLRQVSNKLSNYDSKGIRVPGNVYTIQNAKPAPQIYHSSSSDSSPCVFRRFRPIFKRVYNQFK